MTSTCSTCRHWGEASNYDYTPNSRLRTCDALQMLKHATEEELTTGQAFTVDAEGYWAELITAPSFGCTLHEPKEKR